ncbi:hypothetical protein C7R54_03995 [Achromobacter aloeverae]|uniref:DUF3108 domain-containing protein n=1 Tax=Achromobacter aloeverae TaxID=1750518 RepID=A0A4Q1HPZ2_9BURK|nr:hypothetical protein C7R54_03995 [Achromobacter aloeverae]
MTGCAGPTAVKAVVADPPAYSAHHMTARNLQATGREKLPAAGSEAFGYTTIVMSGEIRQTPVNGRPFDVTFENTYYNDRDDGMLRGIFMRKSNGLPSSFRVDLSYHGFVPLIVQAGSSTAETMMRTLTARDIDQWPRDFAAMPEHGSFTFAWTAGFAGDPVQTYPRKLTCTSGENYPASRFMPQVPGQAIDLKCNWLDDNGVQSDKTRLVYLRAYALALPVEQTTASWTSTTRYDTLQVQ